MPNRYIRESAIESENVDKLSWQAEVFWRRLLNRVDDFGRFTANLELLRASIFPLRLNKVSAADIGKMLLECEQSDLVSTWKGDDGKAYLVMHRWEKGRAAKSRYPEPPKSVCERMQTNVFICEQPRTDPPDPDYDPDYDPESDSRAHALQGQEISKIARAAYDAYPDSAEKDGRPTGKGVLALGAVTEAVRRAPGFPWVEYADLIKEFVKTPKNIGTWAQTGADYPGLESLRKIKGAKENKTMQGVDPSWNKRLA